MGDRSDGSTPRQVLLLEYNDAGLGSGIPQRVFSKSSPHFTSRLITGLTGALQNEAGFYMTLRPEVEMETPIGYYAGVDDASGRSMFLLEDVADTHGARFGDPTSLQVDRAMAESMVENLAAYHGRFWESELPDQSWIQTSLGFQQRVNATIDFEKRSLIGIERSESIAPVEFLRRRDEVWGARCAPLNSMCPGRTPCCTATCTSATCTSTATVAAGPRGRHHGRAVDPRRRGARRRSGVSGHPVRRDPRECRR
jgi:hypothetical protein